MCKHILSSFILSALLTVRFPSFARLPFVVFEQQLCLVPGSDGAPLAYCGVPSLASVLLNSEGFEKT
jgi:hypothetical protein